MPRMHAPADPRAADADETAAQALRPLRILIVDNYDSYTFNLFQLCTVVPALLPVVVRNDQFEWPEFRDSVLPHFDAVVVSPGPGRPDRHEDFGVCGQLLAHAAVPILGVCLGHQGLAAVHGGSVITADPPMHGRLSDVHHSASDLFAGLPSPFKAVRYHSLVVDPQNLPSELVKTAWTHNGGDGKPDIIMGMRHASRPIWSVQFHPESICTDYGQRIIANFIDLAASFWAESNIPSRAGTLPAEIASTTVLPSALAAPRPTERQLSAVVRAIASCSVAADAAFQRLFAAQDVTFWLDSARVESGLSRFSYMGDASGPLSFDLKYSLASRQLIRREAGTVVSTTTLDRHDTMFAHLSQIMIDASVPRERVVMDPRGASLPVEFPFLGGLVGFFGYEMKAESMRWHTAERDAMNAFQTESAGTTPDAAFIFADRVVVFDHLAGHIYLVALTDTNDAHLDRCQRDWIERTAQAISEMAAVPVEPSPALAPPTAAQAAKANPKSGWMTLAHDRPAYLHNIQESLSKINQGETYEVCLTTQLSRNLGASHRHPLELYQHLRRRNPAPYGGFLSFGGGLFIASSSPERFLRLETDGWLSMKPIKGTLPRATAHNFPGSPEERQREDDRRKKALATSEKDRSENLMIVDLIRNDLNQISEARSVHVPHLMVVESYATVHQLVSTVKGKLRPELTAVDAVMRTFPPGSMTGAPKLRTVHILEQLETIPRGPYSGALGFFSVTGPADFSVVIRTAVFSRQPDGNTVVSIGAGGAIVALSDPSDEFDEMLLKANSVLPSLVATFDE
ncbi:para-aminobenzoate synthase, (PABA) [Polyrhizophydium stewartii]|uniref:aminodeoxychorismate synthase n=1 Tax=Polyrhizophydium stewartii TaxID=2732419 RepID=A0ABR4NBM1_9FUNG